MCSCHAINAMDDRNVMTTPKKRRYRHSCRRWALPVPRRMGCTVIVWWMERWSIFWRKQGGGKTQSLSTLTIFQEACNDLSRLLFEIELRKRYQSNEITQSSVRVFHRNHPRIGHRHTSLSIHYHPLHKTNKKGTPKFTYGSRTPLNSVQNDTWHINL